MRDRAVKLVLPILALFAGVYLLWSGAAQIVNALESRFWPEARGAIIASEVIASRSNQASSSNRNPYHYRAEVRYSFDVNGRRHYSRTIAWRDQSSAHDEAQALVRKYAPGKIVTVFYDPDDPNRAILERGFPWSSLLRLTFGALFAGAGVLLVKFVRRWV